MDLDRCPRCGGEWTGGDSCPRCKFVPIGAGLTNLPKQKKKRSRKYVEPGSARGFLGILFVGLLGFGCYRYQPWADDWELVRGWFGQGRHHSLVGDWEVVKTVAVSHQDAIMAKENVEKGSMTFLEGGTVKVDLVHPESETTASGSYIVSGTLVSMTNLQASGEVSDPFPKAFNMNLTWTGSDNVIAMDKSEAIYLHRRKSSGALSTFTQVDLRKSGMDAGNKETAELRGELGDVKRSSAESGANEN